MSRTTIGDIVSRIRNEIKAVSQDAFITDRFLYSLVSKHGKWLMKREDSKNKVLSFNSIFQTLDLVELIEVDAVEASCSGLKSGVIFKRTKEKVPAFMQGYWGPLVRSITSLDGSEELHPTNPSSYLNSQKLKSSKYNTTKYYWFLNDHIYFPKLEWDAVRIEGVFEDDISMYNCREEDDCVKRQDQALNIPDYLHAEMEAQVLKDLMLMYQVPVDLTNDKQNLAR